MVPNYLLFGLEELCFVSPAGDQTKTAFSAFLSSTRGCQ